MLTSVVDLHKINGKRPEYDIYIGRKVYVTEFTKDSIWANHFKTLEFYEEDIRQKIGLYPDIYNILSLRGKRLGCWCINTTSFKNPICHGQILLKILEEKLWQLPEDSFI